MKRRICLALTLLLSFLMLTACGAKLNGFSVVNVAVKSSGGSGGAIDLSNIPEVDSNENPTDTSPTAVICDGEIYLLCEGELKNGSL